MITFGQHINIQRVIAAGGNIENTLVGKDEIEQDIYLYDLEKSYPIEDTKKAPTFDKRIYYSVEDMVFGQFIMVEQILTGKSNLPDHQVDLELAKLIIRPSEHSVFDNEDGHKEIANEQDILGFDVREVYYVLDRFIQRRNKTMFNDYSGVFYDPKEETEDGELPPTSAEVSFHQQWYYYSLVRMLAKEDITRYDEIYMLPMKSVLPEMSYISQKNKIEQAEQRKQQALSKIK